MNAENLHIVDEYFMQGAFKAVFDRYGSRLSKQSADALRKVSMGMDIDPFAHMSIEEATKVKQVFDVLSNHLQNIINMQTAAMANGASIADASMAGDEAMMDPAMMQQAMPVLDGQVPMV